MAALYSFNTYNASARFGLPPSLPAQIAAAAAAGFDHVGLDVPSLLAHQREGTPAEELGEVARRASVPCLELVPLVVGADSRDHAEDLAVVASLAAAVGARCVLATVRGSQSPALVDQLKQAADELGAHGAELLLEPMAVSALPGLAPAIELVRAVDRPNVALALDAWHVCQAGESDDALAAAAAVCGLVQIADAPRAGRGHDLAACLDQRTLPGEGCLPLGWFRDHLRRGGYGGVVSVEVLSAAWRLRPTEDLARAALPAARAVWEPPERHLVPAPQPTYPEGNRHDDA